MSDDKKQVCGRHFVSGQGIVTICGDASAQAGGEVANRLEWLRPHVSAMKARYPKEINIEGLEPALTSDILEIVAAAEARVRADVCQTTWMKAMACFPAASFCGGDWENAWNGALQEVEIRMRAAIAKDGIEIVYADLTSLTDDDARD